MSDRFGNMDEVFDFVVVGSGGGSMCASLVMKTQGKSTLILEKTDLVGGTTATAGGVMWIPNNRFLKEQGLEDSPAKAMEYFDSLAAGDRSDQPGATRERQVTYVNQASRMVDFLVSQGIKLRRIPYWPDYEDDLPGGTPYGRAVVAELFDVNELGAMKHKLRPNFLQLPAKLDEAMKVGHYKTTTIGKLMMLRIALRAVTSRLTGKRYVTAGNALQGRMFQAALKAGVDIRTNSPVKEMILDDSGAVIGVIATIEGKDRRIGARLGVLLNAGGFARNREMREKFQPGTSVDWTNASEGDTGEMIQEGMRLGGMIGQMDQMVGCYITLTPEHPEMHPMIQGDVSNPHSMMVDQTGVRYLREAQSYMTFGQQVLARNKVAPAIPSWMIFDSQFMRKYMLAGTMPGSKKPQEWYDSGFLRKADTIRELAAVCDIPADTLEQSVNRFNELARKGKDDDLHRGDRCYDNYLGDPGHTPSPTLGTVEEGPFYAIKVYPGDVGTYGGLVTDVNARVLRADGTPIPGLYATGTTTASVMGRNYPGAGASIGPSFTWGYIAAKHATGSDNTL